MLAEIAMKLGTFYKINFQIKSTFVIWLKSISNRENIYAYKHFTIVILRHKCV